MAELPQEISYYTDMSKYGPGLTSKQYQLWMCYISPQIEMVDSIGLSSTGDGVAEDVACHN
jgi:hypothetical protein